MNTHDKLPIKVSPEQLQNEYVIGGIAVRAFQIAGYDMSPDNPIQAALKNGFIEVNETDEV